MFLTPLSCLEQQKSRVFKLQKKGVLLYNGQNLLDFDGKEDDYRGFGNSVVRKIFNEDERALYCFSSRRTFKMTRLRAPRNAEKAFKGD